MADDKVILYKNIETGGVVVLQPILNCNLTLEQIAAKDVPPGVPYIFMLKNDLNFFMEQQHPILFDAMEIDFSNPDGVGANFGYGSYYAVDGWDDDGNPILRQEREVQ